MQELLLNPRTYLHCGRERLAAQDLKSLIDSDGLNTMVLDDEDLAILKAASETADISKFKISRFGSRSSVNGNLQDRIVQYRHTECHDLRDRIFSLLGLLHPSEQKDLRRFFPDYSLTDRQVFAFGSGTCVGLQPCAPPTNAPFRAVPLCNVPRRRSHHA